MCWFKENKGDMSHRQAVLAPRPAVAHKTSQLPNNNTELRYHNMNTWTIRMIGEVILFKDQARAKTKAQTALSKTATRPISSDSPAGCQTWEPLKKRRQRQRTKHNFRQQPKKSTDEQNNFAQEDNEEIPLNTPRDANRTAGVVEGKDDADTKLSPEKEKETTTMSDTENSEGEDPCSICHDRPTRYDKTTKMPCNHTFDTACLHHWLLRKNNCPACRSEIGNHSRGMLMQEAAPKTVLYANTGAVTSTDTDRSRLEIDTITQSPEARQVLDSLSQTINYQPTNA